MTLVDFLLLRIAQDEDAARVAGAAGPSYNYVDTAHGETVFLSLHEGGSELAGAHVLRWSPARVLAECEAKRRIIDAHRPITDRTYDYTTCGTCGQIEDWAVPAERAAAVEEDRPVDEWWIYPCPTMKLLALPYADHPDYEKAWRP